MSTAARVKKRTIPGLIKQKAEGEKIVVLTAYDYTTAKLLDQSGVDIILVGDSLAMTVLGHPNTLSVTLEEMLHHVKAVSRGTENALVIADMPFMTYHTTLESGVKNAGRMIQEGRCDGVKMEGANELTLSIVRQLVESGIPVMGHLGLTPQSVLQLGGFKVQGKTLEQAKKLYLDAQKLVDAGVFSIVLEMVPVEVATWLSQSIAVPTIGIGAGNGCDGQVLVIDDLLGRYQDLSPRFVRRYLNGAELTKQSVTQYREDVRDGRFPNNETEAYSFPEAQALSTLIHLAERSEDISSELPLERFLECSSDFGMNRSLPMASL